MTRWTKIQTGPTGKRDHLKRWTSFSKLFRLDRTDPLRFGPKFPEILVEWIAPLRGSFARTKKLSSSPFLPARLTAPGSPRMGAPSPELKKLSSRLFSRPNWLSLGLRGWDDTSFFFFISLFFVVFVVVVVILCHYLFLQKLFYYYYYYFILFIYFFFKVILFFHVPGCSGMFRNVPYSMFYRRPGRKANFVSRNIDL